MNGKKDTAAPQYGRYNPCNECGQDNAYYAEPLCMVCRKKAREAKGHGNAERAPHPNTLVDTQFFDANGRIRKGPC